MTTQPIATNVDAWHAIRADLADGLTRADIAQRRDLSYQMVARWARMPRPPQAKALGRTRGATARVGNLSCRDCGAGIGRQHRPDVTQQRCQLCENRRRSHPRQVSAAKLLAWAAETRLVPTANQAARITGLSRSTAAEVLIEVFGPDPRNGGARKAAGPRRWIPRIDADQIG